ncbi:MAG: hypothetical protein LKCHEGNO_00353 [Burkholderiaceae bacterium]|nr:hypothetical protein [Burkholderiaceae bacterium]
MNPDLNCDRRGATARMLCALGAWQWSAHAVHAQGRDTMRIVIGFPPGPFDAMCRRLADSLKALSGRNVIVENKTGAAGRLAVDAVKAAAADGSTLLVTPASVLTMYPHVYKNLSYDPFKDLAPVGLVARTGFALVLGPMVPKPVDTLEAFDAWCRDNPAQAQCGNPGAGSFPHFMAVLLAQELKLPLGHVPFRGSALSMQAVAGGQVAAAMGTEAASLTLQQTGRVRVVAVTNPERSPRLPEVPTFRELGHERLSQREWFGAFMLAGASASVVAHASEQLGVALRGDEVREAITRAGFAPESSSPAQLGELLRGEHAFWGPIIKASGFKPES